MLTSSFMISGKSVNSLVLMVPSSASSARQWDSLAAMLDSFRFIPFDLHGHGARAGSAGRTPASLPQEAAAILDAIPGEERFHLIGHSYGGGVALKFAASFPNRLKSLSLVEPSCFHLLRQAQPEYRELLAEIQDLAEAVNCGVLSGDYRGAMHPFIDYWGGAGSWKKLSDERKAKLAGLAVHIDHHFRSLIEEESTLKVYSGIRVPTLILCGTHSPRPSRTITRLLAGAMPNARHRTIMWAGHMSSLTHPNELNPLIREHLLKCDASARIWGPVYPASEEREDAFARESVAA
jgi:pimeloyl-ACP methyl ester carboxylesterase